MKQQILTDTSCKVKIVSQGFQSQFSPPGVQGIRSADVASGPLACPMSELEVENALDHLNNERACGPDGVHGELWNNSAGAVSTTLASVFNQSYRKGNHWT